MLQLPQVAGKDHDIKEEATSKTISLWWGAGQEKQHKNMAKSILAFLSYKCKTWVSIIKWKMFWYVVTERIIQVHFEKEHRNINGNLSAIFSEVRKMSS